MITIMIIIISIIIIIVAAVIITWALAVMLLSDACHKNFTNEKPIRVQ